MPKIMKRFHSNGTPIGIVDRMCAWNAIMPMIAIVCSVPPRASIIVRGRPNSYAVPMCAASVAAREGRRSSG